MSTLRNDPTFGPMVKTLSDAELFALCAYTTVDYVPVNAFLRNRDLGADSGAAMLAHAEMEIDLLDRALAKLPVVEGTTNRETGLDAMELAPYQVGAEVTDPAYLSTSADDTTVFPGNVRFLVQSRTGRSIAFLSALPEEAEVLFPRGTRFRVVSRESISEGTLTTLITLEELAPLDKALGDKTPAGT